jgi:adenine deaminase
MRRRLRHRTLHLGLTAMSAAMVCAGSAPAGPPQSAGRDLVITHARLMTVSHGTIPDGAIWIHDGRIAAVGASVAAPAGAQTIDAGGR